MWNNDITQNSHSGSYFGTTMPDGFQVQGTSTIDLDILQYKSQKTKVKYVKSFYNILFL